MTLLKVGISNLPLVKYLVQQGTQSMQDRMDVLHVFYPGAKAEDWKLIDAGIRVQAIKKSDGEAGIVHYGTEVLTSDDRSLSALLGASPGASVSVHIVLDVIKKCLPELLETKEGKERIKEMIPQFGQDLKRPEMAERYRTIAKDAIAKLKLDYASST
jgi:malate dehydrogenase (quinone)